MLESKNTAIQNLENFQIIDQNRKGEKERERIYKDKAAGTKRDGNTGSRKAGATSGIEK